MAERTAIIDNSDLDLIDGFEVDQIRPDAIPERVINAVRLALADGEKFDSANYVNKFITIKSHFKAVDRGAYEIARDQLLGILNSDDLTHLVFEQSNEMREYWGTYENIVFDYKGQGICVATITYRATNPFGETVEESTFYEGNVTDALVAVIETGGNVYGLPKLTATLNNIDDDEIERTLSVTVNNGSRTYNIKVTRVWSLNDTLVIDSKRQKLYVNGGEVEYVGRWPLLLKTNTFRFDFIDAASYDVDLLVKYKKRWL